MYVDAGCSENDDISVCANTKLPPDTQFWRPFEYGGVSSEYGYRYDIYVNGKLIHKIDKGQNYCYLYYGNCKTFVDYQIKTILTKEMYELNCYTVERKE